jgi:signal transduction histidine kinase
MTVVLVVDDRATDRELAATVLGYAGYEVTQAPSGVAGLDAARRRRPDLVITDILMPGMSGYEFVRALREDPDLCDVPVVFSTATYSQEEVRRIAEACGVTHFLPKPSEPSEMVRVVGEVLGLERTLVRPIRSRDVEAEGHRLINDKLVEKYDELQALSAERLLLVDQLLRAHEEERRSLAEQLHDDPIQAIAAVGMRLQMLMRRVHDSETREAIERLHETIQGAAARLRAMVFALVPVELEGQGLAVALELYLAALASEHGLAVTLDDQTGQEAPPATRTLLYRMAQEALANVSKHAAASAVVVTLDECAEGFRVRVRDDGRGFDPEEAVRVRPGHLGLASMRQRITTAGGRLRIESAPGAGATVAITLPAILGGRLAADG